MSTHANKKTIAVVATHYDPVRESQTGGSGIAVYRICKALAAQKTVKVVLICTRDSVTWGLATLGVHVHKTGIRSTNTIDPEMGADRYDTCGLTYYEQVGSILDRLTPDQVVFNAAYQHAGAIPQHTQGRWNIVHVPYGKNPWGERYPNPALGFRELAVSGPQFRAGEAHGWYAAHLDNSGPLMSTQMPPLPNRTWPPKRALFMGRLVPEKGADLAITACKRLRDSGFAPNLHLAICGISEDGEYAEAVTNRDMLPDWAHYYGNVEWSQLADLIRTSDLGFFTSNPRNNWSEAFGMTGVEMLMDGLPIVGITGMGFLPDYARPDTCLLLPWHPDYERPYNDRFASDLVTAIEGWRPDYAACRESVRMLTLDHYGAELLRIITTG